MEAKDLRIGNLVKDQSDKDRIWQVINVDEKVIEVKGIDTIAEHPQFIEYILPIPLNEEWLVKFGFQNLSDENYNHWQKITPIKPFFEVLKRNNRDEFFTVISVGQFEKNVKFVHKLQNLYYELTGEELSLTPSQS